MSVDLVEFLRARLDEDEAAAEETLPLHLRVGRFRGKDVPRWRITKSGTGIIDEDGGTLRAQQIFPAEAAHVVRHDPARVLREVEAKRELLDRYKELVASGKEQGHVLGGDVGEEYLYCVLPALALPYSDHPDFDESWRL